MPQPPPSAPPPGWYTDPNGGLRWWDGIAWGPSAAPPGLTALPRSEEESGKALAVVSWLGYFMAYGLVALVVRIVERDGNRFARWHAGEAVNLQLTLLVLSVPPWLTMMITLITTPVDGTPAWPFFASLPVFAVVTLGALVVVVLGAVRAGQGVWWRCPVAIPFLRRHRREHRDAPTT